MIRLILFWAGVICLFLAAFGVSVRGVSLGWLGLALLAVSTVV